MISKWLQKITGENWGFPYHIILANFVTTLGFALLNILNAQISMGLKFVFIFIGINLVGIIYELWQKKQEQTDRTDMWQDILGNNIGILTGLIEIYFIFI